MHTSWPDHRAYKQHDSRAGAILTETPASILFLVLDQPYVTRLTQQLL